MSGTDETPSNSKYILSAVIISAIIIGSIALIYSEFYSETFSPKNVEPDTEVVFTNVDTTKDVEVYEGISARIDHHLQSGSEKWDCVLYSPDWEEYANCLGYGDEHPPEVFQSYEPYTKGDTLDYSFFIDFGRTVTFDPTLQDDLTRTFNDKISYYNNIVDHGIDWQGDNPDEQIVFWWKYE